MSKADDSILKMLEAGPIAVRSLRGRSAAFQLAYKRLLGDGTIVEHGLGTRQDPIYVGLPGAAFPERKLTVKLADVCLLVLSGIPEDEAREMLLTAIRTGGEDAVMGLCETATNKLLSMGVEPSAAIRRAFNRKHNGKHILPPKQQFDIANRPLPMPTI